jgi:hypothetical protein
VDDVASLALPLLPRRLFNVLARDAPRPFRPVASALRRLELRSLWLGPAVTLLIAVTYVVCRWWHPAVFLYSAELPWRQAVVRLPLSVVAPTAHLPLWGALGQVLLVLTCAQPLLGTARALSVALAGHVVATLLLRLLMAPIPWGHSLLPLTWRVQTDTGPSVAVLAVAICCAVVAGSVLLFAVLVGFGIAEVAYLPDLAGIEHVVGLLVGTALGLAWLRAAGGVRGVTCVGASRNLT